MNQMLIRALLAASFACLAACGQPESSDRDAELSGETEGDASPAPVEPQAPDTELADATPHDQPEAVDGGPSEAPPPGEPDPVNVLPVELPGMRFWPGKGWVREEPGSAMRAAQFRLPLENWDPTERETDAELVVYYFGEQGAGPVQANIDRWLSQFESPPDRPLDAEIEEVELNGLDATTVGVNGTFIAETRPGSGERRNEPNWAMVALIVETDAGPYYIRAVGPRPTIRQHDSGIAAMIDSIEPN